MDRQAIQQRKNLVSSLVGERSLRLAIRQLLLPNRGLERLTQLTARLEYAISAWPEWLQQLLNLDPALDDLTKNIHHILVKAQPRSLYEAISSTTASTRCWMGCATNWTIRTPGSAIMSSRSANAVASTP